jgi:arabinofuranosyltransferase
MALVRKPRSDTVVLAVAFVGLAYLFYENTLLASRIIEGTRYFWLDDDMMISMRYGRNLAEGHGLAWNPGDRVEGYTNFLWTLVMAGVHLTRVADARAAVLVRVVSFVLLAGSFVLSLRLLRIFAPRARFAAPLLLLTMFMCPDVVLWPIWGFEVSLLTFLSLLFLVRVLVHGRDPIGFAALALIPLTRGDGLYVFAAHALIALLLTTGRKQTLLWLAAALVPAALHLAFRRAYYGDWLPNTYYLKVHGVEAITARGYAYGRAFVFDHTILLTLAAASAIGIVRTDRRGIVLFVLVPSALAYVLLTGGDMFGFFRFFAHVMPVIFVFATLGAVAVARGSLMRLVWAAVLLLVSVPLNAPLRRLIFSPTNGDPDKQLRVAMTVKKNALPDSTVAVFCAGIVPYFTRLPAIDLLGKSDRRIAHMKAFPGAMVGHGKVDPEYTFGQNPDLVVTCNTNYAAASGFGSGKRTADPMTAILGSEAFRTRYLPYPVYESFLLQQTAVYTHSESKEQPRRQWSPLEGGPP